MRQDYSQLVEGVRAAFASGRTLSEEFRKHNLNQLLRLYEENTDQILDALKEDLGKPWYEAIAFELEYIKNELKGTIAKLHKWMSPVKPDLNELKHVNFYDDVKVLKEPLGVVLVMGPYNYPIKLITLPSHGAIAAGNCVIMKPSHLVPKSSTLLAKLIPKYLDPECFKVVLADPAETRLLLEQRFDYIFMTGRRSTGLVVAAAAARHLTPISLQMGGKCPVYMDESASVEIVAKRLILNKVNNLGQICLAPDYLLCTPKTRDRLVPLFDKIIKEFYGEKPQESDDLARIINKENIKRLENLIRSTKGKVVSGGEVDVDDRWISPTLIVDVPSDDILMQDEIFGPILPVVLVKGPTEAVEFIRARGKPLAAYVFADDRKIQKMFTELTFSGGVCVNDCILHAGVTDLPFGGVGESGLGPKYHGVHSFLTFTNEKGCLRKRVNFAMEWLATNRYPPHTQKKLEGILKHFRRQIRYHYYSIKLTALLFFLAVLYLVLNYTEIGRHVLGVVDTTANDVDQWFCESFDVSQPRRIQFINK